jgi:hypothetical protein
MHCFASLSNASLEKLINIYGEDDENKGYDIVGIFGDDFIFFNRFSYN